MKKQTVKAEIRTFGNRQVILIPNVEYSVTVIPVLTSMVISEGLCDIDDKLLGLVHEASVRDLGRTISETLLRLTPDEPLS